MWSKIKQIAGLGKVDSYLIAKDKTKKELFYNHPQVKRLIQKAFTIKHEGKKYDFYQFKEIHDMPSRRFTTMNDMIEDMARKMTNDELFHYSEEALNEINQNTPEALSNAITILKMLKMRAEYVVNLDIVLRLISCAFFLKDENILTYDWDLGNWKIDLFEKHGLQAFFLTQPIKEWLPLTNLSDGDLEILLKQREVNKAYLKELSKLGISTINPYDARKKLQEIT